MHEEGLAIGRPEYIWNTENSPMNNRKICVREDHSKQTLLNNEDFDFR